MHDLVMAEAMDHEAVNPLDEEFGRDGKRGGGVKRVKEPMRAARKGDAEKLEEMSDAKEGGRKDGYWEQSKDGGSLEMAVAQRGKEKRMKNLRLQTRPGVGDDSKSANSATSQLELATSP